MRNFPRSEEVWSFPYLPDSDSLETVEKADFVEFSDDSSSMSAGSEGNFNTKVTLK